MNVAYVRTLYDYDRWANQRVLLAVARVDNNAFTKNLGSSHRSVRDTLVHILSAGRTWLARWNGSSPHSHLDPAAFPNVDIVRRTWSDFDAEMSALMSSLTDDQLLKIVSYRTLSGQPQSQPLWQQMAHLANHSTYHRGQITTMLRQLGAEPIPTDLIAFFRESQTAAGLS